MNYLTEKKFSFVSKAVSEDTFGVVSVDGTEGLSQLYQFDISLVSERADIDLDSVMQEPASFFIYRPDGSTVPYHGIIAQCDLVRAVGSYYLYMVRLVPKLWRLTLTHHNQIFLNSLPQDIIAQVLGDGGLTSLDFEFRLQGSYVTWEYACQYGESHYDFVCRWMERNGIYYFFDQSGESEKLIMTDSKMAHVASNLGNELTYAPVSGLEALHLDESVQSYICRRQLVPKNITMKDYDYRKPTLNVSGAAEVPTISYGEQYYYGDHFRTPEEGDKLAKIRSEEFLCRGKQYHGESTVPYLMPGFTFTLKEHFNEQLNTEYLTISMEHRGNQTGYLISGIRENLSERETQRVYSNTFTAIESNVQFRASRTTRRPHLHGTISGRIDAAGSGQYAEVDDQGRYKVILPFDRSGRDGGKASAWVRMMQPYGGSDHGIHFPLHKGCEVLLTFIGGDPDRPVIAGAVANPDNPSQITSDTQTKARLTTSGGNMIHIEDREGEQRILHQSPTANTWFRMGAPNDPPAAGHEDDEDEDNTKFDEEGFGFSTKGDSAHYIGANYKIEIGGFANSLTIGGENSMVVGEEVKIVLGGVYSAEWPDCLNFSPLHKKVHAMREELTENTTQISANRDIIDENVTNIAAEHERISVNSSCLAEVDERVTENRTRIDGEVERITGDVTNLRGQVTNLDEDISDLNASKISMSAEITRMHSEMNIIDGELNHIIGEQAQISGENNFIVAMFIIL